METKHFESIFDHGVTPEEFEKITGFTDKDEYLRTIVTGEYEGCLGISWLYFHRGDIEKAKYYTRLSANCTEFIDYCY